MLRLHCSTQQTCSLQQARSQTGALGAIIAPSAGLIAPSGASLCTLCTHLPSEGAKRSARGCNETHRGCNCTQCTRLATGLVCGGTGSASPQWRSQDFPKGVAKFHGGPRYPYQKITNSWDLASYFLEGPKITNKKSKNDKM